MSFLPGRKQSRGGYAMGTSALLLLQLWGAEHFFHCCHVGEVWDTSGAEVFPSCLPLVLWKRGLYWVAFIYCWVQLFTGLGWQLGACLAPLAVVFAPFFSLHVFLRCQECSAGTFATSAYRDSPHSISAASTSAPGMDLCSEVGFAFLPSFFPVLPKWRVAVWEKWAVVKYKSFVWVKALCRLRCRPAALSMQ